MPTNAKEYRVNYYQKNKDKILVKSRTKEDCKLCGRKVRTYFMTQHQSKSICLRNRKDKPIETPKKEEVTVEETLRLYKLEEEKIKKKLENQFNEAKPEEPKQEVKPEEPKQDNKPIEQDMNEVNAKNEKLKQLDEYMNAMKKEIAEDLARITLKKMVMDMIVKNNA